jgi:hypothetical protein
MRNLLAFLAALVIAFAAVGYYFDWYKIRAVPADTGHKSYTVDINAKKSINDIEKGVHKVEESAKEILQPQADPAAAKAPTK